MTRTHTSTKRAVALAKRIAALAALGAIALACRAADAIAWPVSAGAGLEYYAGPGNQTTRSALVTAGVGIGTAGNAGLGLLRYDDSIVGAGSGVIGTVGFPFVPSTTFQLTGARFVGDESFRGWRVKAGPRISIPPGASLGLYYTHYQDNADGTQNGVVGEASVPFVAGVGLRASAAYANVGEDVTASQGSIGVAWSPIHFVELSGEAGLARNGGVTAAPGGPGRGLRLPIIGGPGDPPASRAESKTEPTLLLGARLVFP
jgi:hypothetical protein